MNESNTKDAGSRFLSLAEVAELVGGQAEGDSSILVRGIAPLEQAGEEELGFLVQRRYLKYLTDSGAHAILVSEALAGEVQSMAGRVVVKDPHAALPPLLGFFYPQPLPEPGIHPTAVLGVGVELGDGVAIGPYAVLGEGVVLGSGSQVGAHCVLGRKSVVGEGTVLHPHVVLYPGTRLGDRVLIHAGVCLGVDGFGFVPGAEAHEKVPQVGSCVIGDDVEIGANTCIDRGSIGQTVIGKGAKLDNLIHLGHNVRVGERVLMAGQVGSAGSSRIGKGVMFGGQVGIGGHVEIGDGARVAGQSGVTGDVPPGEAVSGYPARNHREYLKAMALAFRLPDTMKRLEELERRLKTLETPAEE